MKKLTILTSVLALTACAGGSGGGNDSLTPEQSNARVTNMNSFVVVGGTNPTVNPNARAATTGILQSDGGTRYDLENVTFKSIPTSGVIADLKFHTDENSKIVSIEFPDAERIMADHEGSDITVGEMKRQGDTNIFVEHAVLDEEFGDRAGQTVDIPTEYVSYAEQVGLKYSDFGVLKADLASAGLAEFQDGEPFFLTPFMGGYDIKNVNNEQMANLAQENNIVFTGIAKGQVSYHDWDIGGDIPLEGGLYDENATLTFAQDGSQTLAADFTNWAKIEAQQAENDKLSFKVVESYIPEDSKYYINTDVSNLDNGDMSGEHNMAMQTGYYGDNNIPSEAVGLVQYQHQWGDPYYVESENRWDVENHVNVDLGFGGTRQ